MTALAHVAMEELNGAVESAVRNATSHTEGLKLALAAIVPLGNRQWFLANELVEFDESVTEAYKKDMDELRAEIEAARQEGTFSKEIPVGWITETYQTLVYTAWTQVRDGELTSAQAADLAWRTLTNGLKENSNEY